MAVFVVSYDLRKQGRNYEALYKRLAEWRAVRGLQSLWFIAANCTASELRDDLVRYIDNNDGLFVGVLGGQAAWHQLDGTSGNTLKAWIEGK